MKRPALGKFSISVIALLLFVSPSLSYGQSPQPENPPPIEQPLLREGSLAVQLVAELGLRGANDEVMAESRLGEVGITPRNGWIADYPVTPDIIGELQKSIGDAADAGKISLSRNEAVKKLDDVTAGLALPVSPYTGPATSEPEAENGENYYSPTEVNNYYYNEGPPLVTYYAPPPDFYYLYAWIPYPFWCGGFWFPGFFILHDFHRTIFVGHRAVFMSNHFNDVRANRVFRVDPLARFNGRTFAGIGVSHRRGFISTGIRGSDRRIFNGSRVQTAPGMRPIPGMRTFVEPHRTGGTPSRSYTHSPRSFAAPPRSSVSPSRSFSPPSRGGGTVSPSTRGGGGFSRGTRSR